MTLRAFTAIAFAVGLLASGAAYAQQQAPSGAPDLNAIPEKCRLIFLMAHPLRWIAHNLWFRRPLPKPISAAGR